MMDVMSDTMRLGWRCAHAFKNACIAASSTSRPASVAVLPELCCAFAIAAMCLSAVAAAAAVHRGLSLLLPVAVSGASDLRALTPPRVAVEAAGAARGMCVRDCVAAEVPGVLVPRCRFVN